MNQSRAALAIEYELAKISVSRSPVPDHTFVMGMIGLAEFCDLIDQPTANRYRNELDDARANRMIQLRGIAA